MLVKEIIKTKNQKLITIDAAARVEQAMKLLIGNSISCLPVVGEKDELVGIISDKDIFKRVHADPTGFADATVGDLMSVNIIVGLMTDDIHYIAGIMTKNRIRHVPIVENQLLIGLVSVGDIVKTQIESIEIENRYLKQYIEGGYPG